MPSDPLAPLTTHVGRHDWGDNRFRGFTVGAELVGHVRLWDLFSLAIGGPRLADADQAVLDDVCAAATAADPRIPPLKMARLIGAYGSEASAHATVLLLDQALFGAAPTLPAGAYLVELRAVAGEPVDTDAVRQRVTDGVARRARAPGFGVPGRPRDERVAAIALALARRGRDTGAHWRVMVAAEEILAARSQRSANIAAAFAAVALDLGFQPQQLPPLAALVLLPAIAANAAEAAQQAPAALRQLPAESIAYVGTPPRVSPRSATRLRLGG
jgi:hypothetical protein